METSQAPIQAGRKNVKLSMHKQNYQMSVKWSRDTESVQYKPSVCLQSSTNSYCLFLLNYCYFFPRSIYKQKDVVYNQYK